MIRGIVIGFLIAAPIGPVGLLCIRKTLAEGRLAGFVSGLGAATADTLYGMVSAFGITSISFFLLRYQTSIRIFGGLFLLYLAVRIFHTDPATQLEHKTTGGSLLSGYLSTFVLNITNPTTILTFILLFESAGIVDAHTFAQAKYLVAGMFAGAVIWWLILVIGVGFFNKGMDRERLGLVNRFSAFLIAFLGLFSLILARPHSFHRDVATYARFIARIRHR